jgi:V/A-type H+/Na+-transporting ATPase subunit D
MSERPATRSELLELADEHHAMREGHAFLDEKCLVLAGAMLRELRLHEALWTELRARLAAAEGTLAAALARHGLEALAVHPLTAAPGPGVHLTRDSLLGVALVAARVAGEPPPVADPLLRTPEAAACAEAHAGLLDLCARLAAAAGNLERLDHEYRKAARRARALEAVLLPEMSAEMRRITLELEEHEREDAVFMRPRGR